LALAASEIAGLRAKSEAEKTKTPEDKPEKKDDKPAAKKQKQLVTATLVLGYPEDEAVFAACTSIKNQLAILGLKIELKPLSGPAPRQVPDDVDLLYVVLAVGEPATDAQAILGDLGMTGGCSPYLRLALHQLDMATNWEEAQSCLYRIHRLVHEEAAILPLWQLFDFYAHRKELQGIGEHPVTLYQNIEQWQTKLQRPAEKK
jgi:hypothetical protein